MFCLFRDIYPFVCCSVVCTVIWTLVIVNQSYIRNNVHSVFYNGIPTYDKHICYQSIWILLLLVEKSAAILDLLILTIDSVPSYVIVICLTFISWVYIFCCKPRPSGSCGLCLWMLSFVLNIILTLELWNNKFGDWLWWYFIYPQFLAFVGWN